MIAGNEGLELIEDVAPRLGVATSTLREWCRRGEFPSLRMPHKRRIYLRREWTEAYIAGSIELEDIRHPSGGRIVRPKGCK